MNAQTPTTQLVPLKERASNIRTLLEKSKPQIAIALPKHLSADRMLRIAMTTIQKTPKLLECTPESLLGSIMQASQLGLECDGVLGQAYLVPFFNKNKNATECQLIPGYKGLLKLARNSGELESIYAYSVFEGDHFDVELGLNPDIKHKPNWDTRDFESEKDIKANLKFVYVVAKVKGAEPQFEVMAKSAVERIRRRSKSADSGPWVTDYEAMALKTVIKRISKMLPASVELQKAVEIDNNAEIGLAPATENIIDFVPQSQISEGNEGAEATGDTGQLQNLTNKLKTENGKEVGSAVLKSARKDVKEALIALGKRDHDENALMLRDASLKVDNEGNETWLGIEHIDNVTDVKYLLATAQNLKAMKAETAGNAQAF